MHQRVRLLIRGVQPGLEIAGCQQHRHAFFIAGAVHAGHQRVSVSVQALHTVELALPTTSYYLNWDFSRDVRDDLEQAEK